LQEWIPSHGSVIAVYQSTNKSAVGRSVAGLDFRTGAIFGITVSGSQWDGYGGVTGQGEVYRGQPEVSHAKISGKVGMMSVLGVADSFPVAYLIALRDSPQSIIDVKRESAGDWVVEFDYPTGPQAIERVGTLIVSGDGRPKSLELLDPSTGTPRLTEYVYSPRSPTKVAVVQGVRVDDGSFKSELVEVQFIPGGRPQMFSPEVVEKLADDQLRAIKLRSEAIQVAKAISSGRSPEPVPYAGSDLRRIRWPLVATGVVAITIGVFVLLRVRKDS